MSFDEDGGRIRKICEGWWSSMLLSVGCYEGKDEKPESQRKRVDGVFVVCLHHHAPSTDREGGY
jgi:hypothetical protein